MIQNVEKVCGFYKLTKNRQTLNLSYSLFMLLCYFTYTLVWYPHVTFLLFSYSVLPDASVWRGLRFCGQVVESVKQIMFVIITSKIVFIVKIP